MISWVQLNFSTIFVGAANAASVFCVYLFSRINNFWIICGINWMVSFFFNFYLGVLYNDINISIRRDISKKRGFTALDRLQTKASCDNSFGILMDKRYFTENWNTNIPPKWVISPNRYISLHVKITSITVFNSYLLWYEKDVLLNILHFSHPHFQGHYYKLEVSVYRKGWLTLEEKIAFPLSLFTFLVVFPLRPHDSIKQDSC